MTLSFRQLRQRHLRLGRRGENLACRLLKIQHYDILCRNYKVKAGEIDIVAREGAILVFVEVKTRFVTTGSRPAAGLRLKQQKRIFMAAQNYLRDLGYPKVIYRFDLIELILSNWRVHEVRHWKEHFSRNTLQQPGNNAFSTN